MNGPKAKLELRLTKANEKLASLLAEENYDTLAAFLAVYETLSQSKQDQLSALTQEGKANNKVAARLREEIKSLSAIHTMYLDCRQLQAEYDGLPEEQASEGIAEEALTQVENQNLASQSRENLSSMFVYSKPEDTSKVAGEITDQFERCLLDMPDCAEKMLSLVSLHFFREKLYQKKEHQPLLTLEEIERFIGKVEELLSKEGLLGDVRENIKEIKRAIEKNEQTRLSSQVTKCLEKIRPLDFDLTGQLVSKTGVSGRQIKDQDIILLLGLTGSGKSTTVLFLSRVKFEVTKEKGRIHYAPKYVPDALKSVQTSSAFTSETRIINAVKLDPTVFQGEPKDVYLCDSPGFGDTRGSEIDISNGIALVKALRGAKSVRPIIVFSKEDVCSRGQGYKDLALTLASFISFTPEVQEAIQYLFTKYDKKESFDIPAALEGLRGDLNREEEANQAFVALLDDMIKKTADGAEILDLQADDPEALATLFLKKPTIENTKDIFQQYVKRDSQAKLESQLHKNHESFKAALLRHDIPLAMYRFSQLQLLKVELDHLEVEKTHQKNITFFEKQITLNFEDLGSIFSRIIEKRGSFSTRDLSDALPKLTSLIHMEALRARYFPHQSSLVERVQIETKRLIKTIMHFPEQTVQDGQEKLNLAAIDFISQAVSAFRGLMPGDSDYQAALEQMYETLKQALENQFIAYASQIKQDLEAEDFSSLMLIFRELKNLIEAYAVHLPANAELEYQAIKEFFKQYVNLSMTDLSAKLAEDLSMASHSLDAKTIIRGVKLAHQLNAEGSVNDCFDANELETDFMRLSEELNTYFANIVTKYLPMAFASPDTVNYLGQVFQFVDAMQQESMLVAMMQQLRSKLLTAVRDYFDQQRDLASQQIELLTRFEADRSLLNYHALLKAISDFGKARVTLTTHTGTDYQKDWDVLSQKLAHYIAQVAALVEEEHIFQQSSNLRILRDNLDALAPLLDVADLVLADDSIVQNTIRILTAEFESRLQKKLSELDSILSHFSENDELSYQTVDTWLMLIEFAETYRAPDKKLGIAPLIEKLSVFLGAYFSTIDSRFTVVKRAISSKDGHIARLIGEHLKLLKSNYHLMKAWVVNYQAIDLEKALHPCATRQEFCNIKPASVIETTLKIILDYLVLLQAFQEGLQKGACDPLIFEHLTNALELQCFDPEIKDQQSSGFTEVILKLNLALQEYQNDKLNQLRLALSTRNVEKAKLVVIQINQELPTLKPKSDEIVTEFIAPHLKEIQIQSERLEKVNIKANEFPSIVTDVLNHAMPLSDMTKLTELVGGKVLTLQAKLNGIRETGKFKVDGFFKQIRGSLSKRDLCLASQLLNELDKSLLSFLSLEIEKKLTDLVEDIKNEAAERNKHLASLGLSDLLKNPPLRHFEDLKQLERLSPGESAFAKLHSELFEALSKKINQMIAECKAEETVDIESKIILLHELRSCLPQELYLSYSLSLTQVDEAIKERQELVKQRTKTLREHNNFAGLLDELNKETRPSSATYISQDLFELLRTEIRKFTAMIDNGYHQDFVYGLRNIWPNWLEFSELMISKTYHTKKTELTRVPKPGFFASGARLISSQYGYDYTYIDVQVTHHLLMNFEEPRKICQDFLGKLAKKYSVDMSTISTLCTALKPGLGKLESLLLSFKSLYELYKNGLTHPATSKENLYQSLVSQEKQLDVAGIEETLNHWKDLLVFLQNHYDTLLKALDLSGLADFLTLVENFDTVIDKVRNFLTHDLMKAHSKQYESVVAQSMTYAQMRFELAKRITGLESMACEKIIGNKKAESPNEYDRRAFYMGAYQALSALKTSKVLTKHIDEKTADVKGLEADCTAKFSKHLAEVRDEIEILVKRVPSDVVDDYKSLNIWYNNLVIASEIFIDENIGREAKSYVEKMKMIFEDRLREFEQICMTHQIEQLSQSLIYLKLMSIHLPSFSKEAKTSIDTILNRIKLTAGVQRIPEIAAALRDPNLDDAYKPIVQMIIAEHEVFKSYAIELRNEKTLRHGVDYVLKNLDKNSDNVDLSVTKLSASYEEFKSDYWELVEDGTLKVEAALIDIRTNTALIMQRSDPFEKKVQTLVSHLFAYWTLDNYSVNDAEDSEEKRKYLLQPHAAQVISIFRLLGLDVSDEQHLKNHLVEIGTGEGKSITIAITAMVLALMGYEVDCACYSDYLSQRDFEDFKSMFDAFRLRGKIRYGTFNRLCEGIINGAEDVRTAVINAIQNKLGAEGEERTSEPKRIILIDEVDVFFSKDFYGNVYKPLAELKDPVIIGLFEHIWNNRYDAKAIQFNTIKASKAYLNCCRQFPGWEALIDEALHAMLQDLQHYHELVHVVQNDRIGYREPHGISFDIAYRYKTIFAYFKEHELGNITKSARDLRANILIDCGAFSYAEVPKQYQVVLGVTGTLKTLSVPERRLLEEIYQIKKFSYMPSVYGQNHLDFAKDSIQGVKICKRDSWYNELINEVKARRYGDGVCQRPVLVFFASNEALTAFYLSPELQKSGFRDNVKLITEEISDDQKAGLIMQSTNASVVTLLTRGFGRGTDFKCYDERINKGQGGVHVIQSFVSDQLSEETQIMGRTARQGESGSFSMVLILEDLERYGLSEVDVNRMRDQGKLYSTINESRSRFFMQQYEEDLRYVDEIKADHERAMQFTRDLAKRKKADIGQFLLARNEVIFAAEDSYTLVLMDATGSMSSLLEKAKNTVQAMFDRVTSILNEKRGNKTSFEIQFAVYRNYSSSYELLLQHSAWESDPNNLRSFMRSIAPEGGQGNEAIEIGLWHANQLRQSGKLSQVIVIGDMPANTPNEVHQKRNGRGESYWSHTQFSQATTDEEQLQQLIQAGIKVHCFYVKNNAQTCFTSYAQRTGGQSAALDIDSSLGAELLTQVVCEQVLSGIGGQELVDSYREKFVKGYVSVGKSAYNIFATTGNNNPGTDTVMDIAVGPKY